MATQKARPPTHGSGSWEPEVRVVSTRPTLRYTKALHREQLFKACVTCADRCSQHPPAFPFLLKTTQVPCLWMDGDGKPSLKQEAQEEGLEWFAGWEEQGTEGRAGNGLSRSPCERRWK